MTHPCGRTQFRRSAITAETDDWKRAGPSHEQIAALAYSYWEGRGRQGGSPCEDWLRAEKELATALRSGGGATGARN